MSRDTWRRLNLVVLASVVSFELLAQPLAVGDCNADDVVTVDEVVTMVRIALGEREAAACSPADRNGDGRVTIEEIVLAVRWALQAPPPLNKAFVTATDFQTGSFALVDLAPPFRVEPSNPQRRLGADPVARAFGRRVYVVNRFGSDNVQALDSQADFRTLWQCSTGNGSNPQDIAFRNGRQAYVPLLARPWLLRVDPHTAPDCQNFVQGRIDLGAYADADGSPEANQAAVVGNYLFVTLERLENFAPVRKGLLLVVDTDTDSIVAEIELQAANPFGMTQGLTVRGDYVYIAEVGRFGVDDGGIEAVNVHTLASRGLRVTETELGGDVTDFVLVNDDVGYAIVSRKDFSTALVRFSLENGKLLDVVREGDGMADIELDAGGKLFLADRNLRNPGVRVFRAADAIELTAAPLRTGLPPFDLVVLQ